MPAGDRRPLLRHRADRTAARSGGSPEAVLITDSEADPHLYVRRPLNTRVIRVAPAFGRGWLGGC
jgi:hypothetical protein